MFCLKNQRELGIHTQLIVSKVYCDYSLDITLRIVSPIKSSFGRSYCILSLSLSSISNLPIIFGPTYFSPLVLTPHPLGLDCALGWIASIIYCEYILLQRLCGISSDRAKHFYLKMRTLPHYG